MKIIGRCCECGEYVLIFAGIKLSVTFFNCLTQINYIIMKNIFKNFRFTILLFLSLNQLACQHEDNAEKAKKKYINGLIWNHKIDLVKASGIISDFLKIEDLNSKAKKYTIGGFISKDKLQNHIAPIPAYKFYPCYESNLLGDRVYLAYNTSAINSANETDCYLLPENTFFEKSESNFKFNANSYSADFIKEYLLNLEEKTYEKTNSITKDELIEYSEKFINEYTDKGNSIQSNICLTMDKSEIDSLILQHDSLNHYMEYPCIGIRYFFAYEAGINSDNPNKIRLVFVGVHEVKVAGKVYTENLIYYNNDPTHKALMMEKNWPPSPSINPSQNKK